MPPLGPERALCPLAMRSLPGEVFLRAPGEIGPSEGLSDALLVHEHQGAELAIRVPGLQLAAHLAGQVFAEEASELPEEPAVGHHGDAQLRLVAQPGRERGRAVLDLLLALALARLPVRVRVAHDVGEVDGRVLPRELRDAATAVAGVQARALAAVLHGREARAARRGDPRTRAGHVVEHERVELGLRGAQGVPGPEHPDGRLDAARERRRDHQLRLDGARRVSDVLVHELRLLPAQVRQGRVEVVLGLVDVGLREVDPGRVVRGLAVAHQVDDLAAGHRVRAGWLRHPFSNPSYSLTHH
jgi:hypothetical protein